LILINAAAAILLFVLGPRVGIGMKDQE